MAAREVHEHFVGNVLERSGKYWEYWFELTIEDNQVVECREGWPWIKPYQIPPAHDLQKFHDEQYRRLQEEAQRRERKGRNR